LRLDLSNVARDELQDVVTGSSTFISEREDAPNVRQRHAECLGAADELKSGHCVIVV
jgi:hypothetical protein